MSTTALLADITRRFDGAELGPVVAIYGLLSRGRGVELEPDDRALTQTWDAMKWADGDVDTATLWAVRSHGLDQKTGGLQNFRATIPAGQLTRPGAEFNGMVQLWEVRAGIPLLHDHSWLRRIGRVAEVVEHSAGSVDVFVTIDTTVPAVTAAAWRGEFSVSPGFDARDGYARLDQATNYGRARIKEVSLVRDPGFDGTALVPGQGPFMASAGGRRYAVESAERAERDVAVQHRARSASPDGIVWHNPTMGVLPDGSRVYRVMPDPVV